MRVPGRAHVQVEGLQEGARSVFPSHPRVSFSLPVSLRAIKNMSSVKGFLKIGNSLYWRHYLTFQLVELGIIFFLLHFPSFPRQTAELPSGQKSPDGTRNGTLLLSSVTSTLGHRLCSQRTWWKEALPSGRPGRPCHQTDRTPPTIGHPTKPGTQSSSEYAETDTGGV